MPSDQELQSLARRFALCRGTDETAPAAVAHFAYYEELPGCLAQADSPDAAVRELDTLALKVLQLLVARGGTPPLPISVRTRTSVIRVGPIFVGTPADFAQGATQLASDTALELTPAFSSRTMEDVEAAA